MIATYGVYLATYVVFLATYGVYLATCGVYTGMLSRASFSIMVSLPSSRERDMIATYGVYLATYGVYLATYVVYLATYGVYLATDGAYLAINRVYLATCGVHTGLLSRASFSIMVSMPNSRGRDMTRFPSSSSSRSELHTRPIPKWSDLCRKRVATPLVRESRPLQCESRSPFEGVATLTWGCGVQLAAGVAAGREPDHVSPPRVGQAHHDGETRPR